MRLAACRIRGTQPQAARHPAMPRTAEQTARLVCSCCAGRLQLCTTPADHRHLQYTPLHTALQQARTPSCFCFRSYCRPAASLVLWYKHKCPAKWQLGSSQHLRQRTPLLPTCQKQSRRQSNTKEPGTPAALLLTHPQSTRVHLSA